MGGSGCQRERLAVWALSGDSIYPKGLRECCSGTREGVRPTADLAALAQHRDSPGALLDPRPPTPAASALLQAAHGQP